MSRTAATCVNYILRRLHKTQFLELVHELEYLKFYIMCLTKWKDSSFGRENNFGFLDIEAAIEEAAEILNWDYPEYPVEAIIKAEFLPVASNLLEKVQQCKPKIMKDCLDFLDCPFPCEVSSDELRKFIMCISVFLHNLLLLKADTIPDMNVKVKSLQDHLDLFKQVSEFATTWCSSHQDLKDFKIHFQAWVSRAACLSLLYWVLDVNYENVDSRIGRSTSEVVRMSFVILKTSEVPSVEYSLTASKLVLKIVQLLKDNLQVDAQKDDMEILFIDLIFLITFLLERPENEKSVKDELILRQADAVVNEATSLISSLISGEIKEGADEERISRLHNCLKKSNLVKAEVRKIYTHLFPDSSSFTFPRINVLGFIDLLLKTLNEFSFHFPKYLMVMLQEELFSLKESDLRDFSIPELQNKHKDIRDLWTRIVNLAYNAERIISSFIYMKKSLWHDFLWLSDVIEEVKLIKGEMKRIKDQYMYDIHVLKSKPSSSRLLPLQANIGTTDKVVGFRDELKEIRGQLIRGTKQRDIISIVGMPGVGKSTLAKKVYSDTSVRYHFHKCAWCTVSQTINRERMLLDILSHLDDPDDHEFSDLELEEEDLAERVYKCLKRRRYLIVLDDIWDVGAWNMLKMSFPEDNNGSRIIFTSRIQKVVSEAKSGCTHFPLNPLPEEECWKLLEIKLFDQGSCPPDFVGIGMQIAMRCKGLPLAVVLVAGLLRKNIQKLDWWKKVGENLDSLLAKEGCTGVLELSYKHLPEILKPCFLYFGSFPEDEEIRVKELTQLWISENFIQSHEMKSLEAVAEEYLTDLVDRSLVIATKRNSTGGIKLCRVHDLLHDFCLARGEDENIFKVIRRNEDARYFHYRVCISEPQCWISFLKQCSATTPFVHSIHTFYRSNLFPGIFMDELWKIRDLLSDHIRQLKFLRVLNLSSYLPLHNFPDGIIELSFLRSLVLWGNFRDIPSTIKRLENLEILGLHSWILNPEGKAYEFRLPLTTWEMQKLREVRLDQALMPWDLCDDTPSLQNVKVFSVKMIPYDKGLEMLLRKIPNVEKLKFALERGRFFDSNQIMKLDFLSHLESLNVSNEFVPALTFHRCAFNFPSTLKKLNFKNFRHPWSEISAISRLPNLEVLKLYTGFCRETWNVEDDEFLKLKFLKLECLDIEKWNASDESFPFLETLLVEWCVDLRRSLPDLAVFRL